jgi:tetratricopeptide (TPR) repeat protein
MGKTFYRRNLKKDLKILERKSRPCSLFDDKNKPDSVNTKRNKLKQAIDKYLARGDLKRAEKKLKKILRIDSNDHFALSKLISLYTKQERFEEAEKIYKSAEKRESDAPVAYTSGIVLYYESGKPDKSREIFELAVDRGFADDASYSAMLHVYINTGDAEGVGEVIGLASRNNIPSILLFRDAFDFYFNNGKFDKALEIIESSPALIRESPRMRIAVMEVHRRLKSYESVIELADEFIGGYAKNSFDSDYYIHARTIRAFCYLHSRYGSEALEEFSVLKDNVDRSSVHYPRILCGFVFSKPTLTEAEREHLLADLDFFGIATGESMQDKIDNAIRIISKDQADPSNSL